jgi:hypothetical protein
VKNDEAQLNFLGYDVDNIRNEMIGLIGKSKNEQLRNYFRDMRKVCAILILLIRHSLISNNEEGHYA